MQRYRPAGRTTRGSGRLSGATEIASGDAKRDCEALELKLAQGDVSALGARQACLGHPRAEAKLILTEATLAPKGTETWLMPSISGLTHNHELSHADVSKLGEACHAPSFSGSRSRPWAPARSARFTGVQLPAL